MSEYTIFFSDHPPMVHENLLHESVQPVTEYTIFFSDHPPMVHENLLSESVQPVSKYTIFLVTIHQWYMRTCYLRV